MSIRPHLFATAILTVASLPATAQVVVGDVYSSDASIKGTIMQAGTGVRVFSGSQVSAGLQPAVLKLARGGEVKVCPGTNLTVSASASGAEMLFSVSTGALEFHYGIDSGADSIMTPDFQLRLTGPGEYHIGIGADQRGATCVRGLQRNTGQVAVFEMLGDGRYQVQPGEEVVFHDGRVNSAIAGALAHCGCPDPLPVMRAETKPVEAPNPTPAMQAPPAAPQATAEAEPHVQVDAPFVFRGDKTEPDVPYTLLRLTTRSGNDLALKLVPVVLPPAEPTSKEPTKAAANVEKSSGGFLKKLGRFFSRMFRG